MDNVIFFQVLSVSPSREKVEGVFRYVETAPWRVNVVMANARPYEVRNLIRRCKPVGCIVERGLSSARIPRRLFANIPVVYIDQRPVPGDKAEWCVCNNSTASVQMAFVELERGSPASYAFVRDMRRKIWNEEREREFLRLASGKTCFILDESLSLTERLAELPKPCGLLAATDAVARKAIDAAHLAGIEMPDELRIVGINNDTFICEFSNPTITSVHPDFEECGYIAMEALHKIVENPDAEPKVLFFGPKGLVRRASSRLLRCRDARVIRALDYIETHYRDPEIDSGKVAGVMECSRSLADLRFKQATGRTIREEIQSLRIERAKQLLMNPRRIISAVPALCGFLSQTTFMRFFKTKTGMTMSEYRRAHSGA